MPRPVWTGTISFGLIAIPVKLFHAVQRKSVSFNQLDDRSMSRIKYKKVSASDGEEVPDEHIVKGYEVSKDRYVVVDPDDLEPFIPSATKTVDLEEFVDLADIDPVYFDTPYFVAPGTNPKPYVLLARAMEESGKVAIGRFVMRNKQYTAAIRAQDGRLVMSTLAYADEVTDPATIEELEGLDEIDVSAKEVKMAEALVDSLTADFEPAKYRDEYREQVLDLIRMKAAGEEFEVPEVVAEKPKVVDLMAALEASVKAAKQARGRHPAVGRHEVGGEEEEVCVSAGVETDVEGRRLTLSNLDKVLYPSGFTKAQVIDYYARIAPIMIPHLRGRCLTFRRYPNGSDTTGFFEKRCPSHRPDWVDVATGPGDRRGGVDYCRIEERAALVWAANLAALELHAPMALAAELDVPRAIVFDFDPGAPATIVDCCEIAIAAREVLAAVDLVGWCKTSGSKGLQMYVPINTGGVTHEGAADFALAVGQVLEQQMPRRVTTVMAKVERPGKIFVDWSQNAFHKTTIAPYSLRARPDPTVSTPVTWDEIEACAAGDVELRFTADDVLERVDAHGDLFAGVLSVVQSIPSA